MKGVVEGLAGGLVEGLWLEEGGGGRGVWLLVEWGGMVAWEGGGVTGGRGAWWRGWDREAVNWVES